MRTEGAVVLDVRLAEPKSVGRKAIVIAGAKHAACIQVVIGTSGPARIAAPCQSDGVELTRRVVQSA
jgi:predicted oxidoreductase